jgi:KaiC/GvpD/RAD55 family RecA-like ATPase
MSGGEDIRASTGVDGLDRMLKGGLIPGRPYIVSGTTGSGKTTLGVQFLQQGVRQGERALMIAIDEPPAEIRENVRYLGWDVGKIRILDVHPTGKAYNKRVSVVEVAAQRAVGSLREARTDASTEAMKQASPELSVQSLQLMLRQELQEVEYSRLVLDSITTLKRMAGDEDTDDGIMSLIRFLSEANVTSMVITDLPDSTRVLPEIFLSRGEIRLHKQLASSKIERYVTIENIRGSPHDTQPRYFRLDKGGMTVDSRKKVSKSIIGMLQGLPAHTK